MRKREIIGMGLLIVGAAGMLLSMRNSTPHSVYLVAARDVAPGAHISATDFVKMPLDLRGTSTNYISAAAKFSNRQSLRRIKKGEIIPRDAISKAESIEKRKEVTLTLTSSKIPPDLKSGDQVDIYFFKVPQDDLMNKTVELLKSYERVRIYSVTKPDGQFNGEVTATVLIYPEDVQRFLTLQVSSELLLVKSLDDE